jgi:hypothetical protein
VLLIDSLFPSPINDRWIGVRSPVQRCRTMRRMTLVIVVSPSIAIVVTPSLGRSLAASRRSPWSAPIAVVSAAHRAGPAIGVLKNQHPDLLKN